MYFTRICTYYKPVCNSEHQRLIMKSHYDKLRQKMISDIILKVIRIQNQFSDATRTHCKAILFVKRLLDVAPKTGKQYQQKEDDPRVHKILTCQTLKSSPTGREE